MLDELQSLVGGKVCLDLPTRQIHARDGSFERNVPAGVFYPENEADLIIAVQFLAKKNIPFAVRGGGTGKTGGCLTSGLQIELGTFFKSIILSADGQHIDVGAGATIASIEKVLAKKGLSLGFPCEWNERSIGGLFGGVAPNYPGPSGTLAKNILGGLFLLPDGYMLDLGGADSLHPHERVTSWDLWPQRIPLMQAFARCMEGLKENYWFAGTVRELSSMGNSYQAAHLLCGALGKNGVLLNARLKVFRKAADYSCHLVAFQDLPAALDFLTPLLDIGRIFIDLIDHRLIRAARLHFKDEWLEWADKSGGWIAQIKFPSDMSGAKDILRNLPKAGWLPLANTEEDKRFSFILRSGLMRGGKGLLRASLNDYFFRPDKLEMGLDCIREVLARQKVVAGLLVHIERGQVEILPLATGQENESPVNIEEYFKNVGYELAKAVVAAGGSIGLDWGLGHARSSWRELIPGLWRKYQEELSAIIDPGGVFSVSKNFRVGDGVQGGLAGVIGTNPLATNPLAGCTNCGACRGTDNSSRLCPGFAASGMEESTPRAKAMLAEAFFLGDLEPQDRLDEKVTKAVSWCLQCRMCETGCPAGLDVPGWSLEILKAKYLAGNGGEWLTWLLANADRLAPWLNVLAPLVNPLLRFSPTRWVLEKITGLARERNIPPFANKTFLEISKSKGWDQVPSSPRMRAAIFVDYFANHHRPAIGEALISILHHNRVEALVPKGQISSGFVDLVQGNQEAALENARVNLGVYADFARNNFPIVCMEPTAALFLRRDLPKLIPGEESRLVASQVVEATNFLFNLFQEGLLRTDFRKLDLKVDHHVPCHIRALERGACGPKLLGKIPGLQVRILDVSCSGMAGLWGMDRVNFQGSLKIGAPMLSLWADGSAKLGSSECSSCRLQMEHGDSRPVLHPVELLAWSYGILPNAKLDKMFPESTR